MRHIAALLVAVVVLAACSSRAATEGAASSTAVAPTSMPASEPSTTVAATTSTTSTTEAVATSSPYPADFLGEEIIGTSVGGRPIVASHRGTAGGTVVLVVGVIHGNESDGLPILDNLRAMPLPVGIDLWILDTLNPDGLAADQRGNGNAVDLNRNFPHDWTAIASPGVGVQRYRPCQ